MEGPWTRSCIVVGMGRSRGEYDLIDYCEEDEGMSFDDNSGGDEEVPLDTKLPSPEEALNN